jgi:very-short-patch-repair endonuclease
MSGSRAIDSAVQRLAASQYGVVARRQLLELGLGEDAIDHRLGSGRLVRLRRGVYAVGHAQLRREGAVLAAVLSARAGAVLSHRSAARLWGLRPWSGRFVEVTAPGHGGVLRREDVLVHRSADLLAHEVTRELAVPTTTIPRTLLDLAAVVPPHHLRRAVERAEQAELFHLPDVRRAIDDHPGRAGWRPLVLLIADLHGYGEAVTRSDLEALLLQLCIDNGLPRPQVNRYDGVRESDFRWPARRLIVEVDSWTFHGRTRGAFEADRERDRQLLLEGWRVARFADRQLLADPGAVAAELADLLAASGR